MSNAIIFHKISNDLNVTFKIDMVEIQQFSV